jgi:hypothetical protein
MSLINITWYAKVLLSIFIFSALTDILLIYLLALKSQGFIIFNKDLLLLNYT